MFIRLGKYKLPTNYSRAKLNEAEELHVPQYKLKINAMKTPDQTRPDQQKQLGLGLWFV